ncbi:MAG TPA: Nif11 family protein [Terriglobia bacterium]|nr:Nif11 family protein [Terriglobia bacterium]
MSKENVVLFAMAANRKPELNMCLAETEETADWVNIASDAGFEFTAEEFCAVIEETIRKKVTTDNAVIEFVLARQAMGAGELSRRALYSFIGGVSRTCDFQSFFLRGAGT